MPETSNVKVVVDDSLSGISAEDLLTASGTGRWVSLKRGDLLPPAGFPAGAVYISGQEAHQRTLIDAGLLPDPRDIAQPVKPSRRHQRRRKFKGKS